MTGSLFPFRRRRCLEAALARLADAAEKKLACDEPECEHGGCTVYLRDVTSESWEVLRGVRST